MRPFYRNLGRLPLISDLGPSHFQRVTPRRCSFARTFHSTPPSLKVIPYILADIGEGITECQVMSWSVKPGDRVEQFDNICEVQSDKASVEITSRFDGTIKALHYETSDMAIVGQPLLDIDVDDSTLEGMDDPAAPVENVEASQQEQSPAPISNESSPKATSSETAEKLGNTPTLPDENMGDSTMPPNKSHLVTPAVRHMIKKHDLDITRITGTGKDGRILKEDVQQHIQSLSASSPSSPEMPSAPSATPSATPSAASDRLITFSPIETQMFNVMTRSLNIPHFLYSHGVDFTSLNALRKRLNKSTTPLPTFSQTEEPNPKFTPLPFIMKALSLAFLRFPKLNSHLDTHTKPDKPQLVLKTSHNFGIAVDTPQGLLVPVVQDVQNHSVASLANEIQRISILAKDGKLKPADFKGATFTVSNIGSIGGGVVAPVIVQPMVGIVAVGQARSVPVFETNEEGIENVVKREEVVLSWSADHRVIDGATVARCAKVVDELLKNFELISATLK